MDELGVEKAFQVNNLLILKVKKRCAYNDAGRDEFHRFFRQNKFFS